MYTTGWKQSNSRPLVTWVVITATSAWHSAPKPNSFSSHRYEPCISFVLHFLNYYLFRSRNCVTVSSPKTSEIRSKHSVRGGQFITIIGKEIKCGLRRRSENNIALPKMLRCCHKIAKSDYKICHVRLSVCLSVRMEQLGSQRKDFHEIRYFSIFRKICREISSLIKIWQTGTI